MTLSLNKILIAFLFVGFVSLAHAEGEHQHKVSVQVTNSPVKEKFVRFSFELPSKQQFDSAEYSVELKDSDGKDHKKALFDEKVWKKKSVKLESSSQGITAKIDVSGLNPAKYEIEFKIKPIKTIAGKVGDFFKGDKDDEGNLKAETVFEIDPSLEVADPGEQGKLTLAGIDSDHDGVRDDVQRWINETYANSPRSKAGAKQMAQDFQSRLLSYQNKEQSIAFSRQVFDSMDCMEYVLQNSEAESIYRHQLEANMLNTKKRIQASIQTHVNFNGQSGTIDRNRDRKSKCRFDPDSLAQ